MSWHCSRALVEAFSVACCSGGGLSAPSKSTHTAVACSCKDKTTECSLHSRFGTTSARLTGLHGAAKWMSSLADSPASRSLLPASAAPTPMSETFGLKPSACFVKYDHDSRSWRTFQGSLLTNTLDEYSETWPRRGSMRSGACYQPPRSERPTAEIESGFWPTPDAAVFGLTTDIEKNEARRLRIKAQKKNGNGFGIPLAVAIRMWPTPRANDSEKRGNIADNPRSGLPAAAIHWPTPKVHDAKVVDAPSELLRNEPTLAMAVKRLPTPQARDWKDGASPKSHGRHSDALGVVVGGSLNPMWVAWLMGWPIGWANSEPLETDKFRSWLQQHGVSSGAP